MSLPRFHRFVFAAAVLVYVITAWNSTGYHSADEHFQIIAFAQWKLGELPAAHLAWEFNAGIRSSFQPWIAVGLFKCAGSFGVEDAFMRTFLLRLITAFMALFAMKRFVEVTRTDLTDHQQRCYIVIAYGLWFLPFLAVRFSSEGWSAIFLLLSLTTVLRPARSPRWAIYAGLYAGVAMICRPATGLIVCALIAWLLVRNRVAFKSALLFALSSFLVLLSGIALDRLFYGAFVPTTWNYLRLGFVGDPLIQFDTLPWYYYPPWIIKYAIPPIGALILLALAVLLVKRPGHVLVWLALPYLIVHSIVGHKELRFLYPLAPLVPWLLMEAWSLIAGHMNRLLNKAVLYGSILVLVVCDLLGLLVVLTSPAGEGRVRLAEILYDDAQPGDRIGYAIDLPIAWRITLPGFYQPPGTLEEVIPPHGPYEHPERLAYIVVQDGIPQPIQDTSFNVTPLARTEHMWATTLLRWYTWDEGQKPWTLYRVQRSDP